MKKNTYISPAILSDVQLCMESIIAASAATTGMVIGANGDGQYVDNVYDTSESMFNHEWK